MAMKQPRQLVTDGRLVREGCEALGVQGSSERGGDPRPPSRRKNDPATPTVAESLASSLREGLICFSGTDISLLWLFGADCRCTRRGFYPAALAPWGEGVVCCRLGNTPPRWVLHHCQAV